MNGPTSRIRFSANLLQMTQRKKWSPCNFARWSQWRSRRFASATCVTGLPTTGTRGNNCRMRIQGMEKWKGSLLSTFPFPLDFQSAIPPALVVCSRVMNAAARCCNRPFTVRPEPALLSTCGTSHDSETHHAVSS